MKFKLENVALFAIVGLHVLLLSRLIFFPYPELFVYPYLTNHGLLPYAQIFDQHFPGLMFLPINLGNLGMTTPEIARIWLYGLVVLSHIFLFLVSKKLLNSGKWALVVNLLYLVWQPFFEGPTLWIESFLTPVLLAALYFLIAKKLSRWNLFLSGICLGAGLVFKQVVGPLIAATALYLFIKEKYVLKRIIPFVLGAVLPVGLILLYIVKLGIWQDFYFWTVTFNLTTFAEMGRKYPDLSGAIRSGWVLGPAILISLYFLAKRKVGYLVLPIFLFGSLIFAYARFDLVHLQPSLPFALVLIVLFLSQFKAKFAYPLFALHLIFASFFLYSFYSWNVGNKVYFFGEEEHRVASEVVRLTKKDDKVFAMATFPHLYQLADRLPPGNVFVFHFPWFMVRAEERVLSGIISDPPKVVVRDLEAEVDGVNLASAMPRIARYIDENYKTYQKIGPTEIMLPK